MTTHDYDRRTVLKLLGAVGITAAAGSAAGCPNYIDGTMQGVVKSEQGFIPLLVGKQEDPDPRFIHLDYVLRVQTDEGRLYLNVDSDEQVEVGELEERIQLGTMIQFPYKQFDIWFGGYSNLFQHVQGVDDGLMATIRASEIQVL